MLSAWGVAWEGVNVEGNEAGLAELHRLGAPNVPAVAVDGKIVHGWQPRGYAELLGVDFEEEAKLTPDQLRVRLDQLLAAAQEALRAAPPEVLAYKPPRRDRTVRNLGFHVFRLSAGFLDGLEGDGFKMEWLHENAPDAMAAGDAVASFGDQVRHRLAAWFAVTPVEFYDEQAETYYGPCSVHDLLERTTWHAAQHTRQIYFVLGEKGVLPVGALDGGLLEGLPLPQEMW